MGKKGNRKTVSLKKFMKEYENLPYTKSKIIYIDGKRSAYEIRDNGCVMSYRCKNGVGYKLVPHAIIGGYDSDGYHIVCLRQDKKQHTYKIHRLVAEAFIPNPNNCKEVNHKNGLKLDNRISNLEWVTTNINIKDRSNRLRFVKSIDNNKFFNFTEESINEAINLITTTKMSVDKISERTFLPVEYIQTLYDIYTHKAIRMAYEIQSEFNNDIINIKKSSSTIESIV